MADDLPTPEKLAQEEKSLLNIRDFFKKIVITKGIKQPYYNENGIMIIGLRDFLLNPKSLEF